MKVKNYTSGVPANRSLMLIEEMLINIGATNISKSIDVNKEVDGIVFMISVNNKSMLFKLKARTEEVYKSLFKKERNTRGRQPDKDKQREQAKRTAWKLLYDRVSMDATDILLGQMELMEIFLSRAYDIEKDQTFFEMVKESGFKQLSEGIK